MTKNTTRYDRQIQTASLLTILFHRILPTVLLYVAGFGIVYSTLTSPNILLIMRILLVGSLVGYAIIVLLDWRNILKATRNPDHVSTVDYVFEQDEMTINVMNIKFKSTIVMPYSTLIKARILKKYIWMYQKANRAFLLNKDGFTEGNADELIQILADHGVKLAGRR